MNLNAAHARPSPLRVDFDFLFPLDSAGDQRPGHDRSKALDDEGAIDGQAEGKVCRFRGGFESDAPQVLKQPIEALARRRADGHNRRSLQKRARHELVNFERDQVEDVALGEVRFGEGNHAPLHPQQAANLKVLARLRLDGFVGGDD